MNPFKSTLTFLSILAFTSSLYADWHSGGGQLPADHDNPWFIHNTLKVSYCFKIDENNFGVPLESVREAFDKAREYWKEQFQHFAASESSEERNQVRTGMQSFTEETCTPKTDMIIQLGVLSEAQKSYFEKPDLVIANTVRTEYDPVNLRGKGFIYVSPEKGPLALRYTTAEHRWSRNNGNVLTRILIHEMGHVFGLKHSDRIFAMFQEFPSLLIGVIEDSDLSPEQVSDIISSYPLPNAFIPPEKMWGQTCDKSVVDEFARFFDVDVPTNSQCVRVEIDRSDDVSLNQMRILVSESTEGPYRKIYQGYGNANGREYEFNNTLFVTPEQKVLDTHIQRFQQISTFFTPNYEITYDYRYSARFDSSWVAISGINKHGMLSWGPEFSVSRHEIGFQSMRLNLSNYDRILNLLH